MAIPQVVSSSNGSGQGSQTISPGSGLSFVFISTEAQNLPTTNGTTINNNTTSPAKDWTCIVGTKAGAGASYASQYVYVFVKVTNGTETITTGDSGVFQVYGCLTVSGYHSSQYEALTSGSGTFSAGKIYSQSGITTLGPDRLFVGAIFPRADTTNACTADSNPVGGFSGPTLTGNSDQVSFGSGGGVQFRAGGVAAQGATAGIDWNGNLSSFYASAATGYVAFAVVPANVTLYGTASLSGTGSLTSAGTRKTFGASSATGTGSMTVAGVRTAYDSAFPTGVGAMSATGQRTTFDSAALAGTGTLTAGGTRTANAAAALTGTGSLTAAGLATHVGRRRLFAADPMLTGSPMRSSIDLTK